MSADKRPAPHVEPDDTELAQSEERFRVLVETVKDYAIFMLDPDGYIQSWNAGAERINGYTAGEVIGRHFSIFFPESDRLAGKPQLELTTAAEHGRFEDESWRIRKDGSRFWSSIVITALRDEHGRVTGFAKVTRDLTDRLAREEAERRAALHEEANRIKDDFLAIVSHELRTPLNVVYGSASMLQSGTLSAEGTARSWASLNRNLQMLMQIIDDLLDISRIVTGKLALEVERLNAVGLLREIIDEFKAPAEARGVGLSIDCAGGSAWIDADRGRFRQIFSNLLSNALKFTAEGGNIDVRCTSSDDTLRLDVIDTGIGIDPEFLPRLFERFSQGDATVQRTHAGLGLGLAITRELVSRHGGSVTATSGGPGRGATFTVILPLTARP
jgi:PAS domain S-box-containing protein